MSEFLGVRPIDLPTPAVRRLEYKAMELGLTVEQTAAELMEMALNILDGEERSDAENQKG